MWQPKRWQQSARLPIQQRSRDGLRHTRSATSYAYDINNTGQIAGYAYNSAGYWHGFLYSDGVIEDLGTLPGDKYSMALGINDNGDIVGESGGQDRAFLYSDGVLMSLNSLIPSSPRWILEDATAINDSGQIVGEGVNPDGYDHAFLLTPTPEPCTFALLGVGAIALAAYAWRRRLAKR